MPFRLLIALGFAALIGPGLLPAAAVERPEPAVNEKLLSHQSVFQPPRLINVSEHVTVAYGYTMSNIVMIEGDRGIFIFDTGPFMEIAETVLAAFRTKTGKPILGVAYSHGHGDHTGGVRSFIPAGLEEAIPLYAHASAGAYIDSINSATSDISRVRSIGQIGLILPEGPTGTVGAGVGPVIRLPGTGSYLAATHPFEDEVTIDLGGTTLRLFHAPSDLGDAIAGWVEEDGVLLAGDAVVGTQTYPFLTTPRFDKDRDPETYIATLNMYRDFDATYLVGGHGLPSSGAENVSRLVERTHLVARYIVDETLRQINLGKNPEDIAANLRIPGHVLGEEKFEDYYHRLSWIVRGVYNKEMGWFGGDTLELVALPRAERAQRAVDAMGGRSAVLTLANESYTAGDFRWAADLATTLLLVDATDGDAVSVKAHSLRAIGLASDSANERNYLLTEADLMLNDAKRRAIFGRSPKRAADLPTEPRIPDTAAASSSAPFISKLRIRADASRHLAEDISISLKIIDRHDDFQLTLTDGVIIHERPALRAPDAMLAMHHSSLVLLADAHLVWEDVLKRPDVSIDGDEEALNTFMSHLNWD
jgi:linear primary-alkylsulfatase